jgi:hypothetical protein
MVSFNKSLVCLLFLNFIIRTSSKSTFKKRILAWTSPSSSELAAKQMLNESWKGLFTGYMGFCGTDFATDGSISFNKTTYHGCSAIRTAVVENHLEFHMCLGTVPPSAINNPQITIDSAVKLALANNWSGYNIDDESHTAPRGTVETFTAWVEFINAFANGLHNNGLQLTADVQSVTLPWNYSPAPELTRLLTSSTIDRWINMDTYYFSTGRFLDALDYYSKTAMKSEKCGVGMMNRKDITYDGYQARFHAIQTSGVIELDMFIAPISDAFLPYLWKFKTGCQGCTNGGTLTCWSNLQCH